MLDLFGEPLAPPPPKRPRRQCIPKADAQLTLWDRLRELWPEKAEEWANARGLAVEAITATGRFLAGGKWYMIGNVENRWEVQAINV